MHLKQNFSPLTYRGLVVYSVHLNLVGFKKQQRGLQWGFPTFYTSMFPYISVLNTLYCLYYLPFLSDALSTVNLTTYIQHTIMKDRSMVHA